MSQNQKWNLEPFFNPKLKPKMFYWIGPQTPIPRKISAACQKVLDPVADKAAVSCKECLKLGASEVKEEMAEDPKVIGNWELEDPPFECEQGSVQQSRLSSQFVFQCCYLLQLLNTQKNVPFNLNLHFDLQFWGVQNGFLIGISIWKSKCRNANWDPK